MTVFEASIPQQVALYLNEALKNISSVEDANQKMYDTFRCIQFFDCEEDLHTLRATLMPSRQLNADPDRSEYGDFQTNLALANNVAAHLKNKDISPDVVIEPTCGKGNFILAALQYFPKAKHIFGVEIYKPYVWETRFNIIDFYLTHPTAEKPDITIIHSSVFDVDFETIASTFSKQEILIIGNPPWVTNAKLSTLNSQNLPQKSNFKNLSGLDAMTGKGNFDIAEYISLMMIRAFEHGRGHIALLVKNTVIKNIVYDQYAKQYAISDIEKHCIDSKKEFNVSVEAALFYCRLNTDPAFACAEFDFYNNDIARVSFGWEGDKFVSNLAIYHKAQHIDGNSAFEWRQGIKHDCSSIMELEKADEHYVNGLKEEIQLEDGLVYGILKSSDLKTTIVDTPRRYTIVTQRKVGQETSYIRQDYPQTYQYLIDHQHLFSARKSSIYKNKPPFSIFGIGDYSFKPYKVAISGLYKTFHFTLVLPQDEKPVMLDDTCYMLGFDRFEFAAYTLLLLNSDTTKQLLQSITFADAKRTFTKDVLMRIDLLALATTIERSQLEAALRQLNDIRSFGLTLDSWEDFIIAMTPAPVGQIGLFV
ncbi:hypothetical protein [Chitinophaga rhizophila]|uniref:N-6 DNA methylase n=1 Tax=Chitinophaga rhizophila TaxID=2866212 RepID=A0ABS7GHQ5_9BACT|nr:hypothetical protein [Chitinophaga rhizophila]MBW8687229.1 hypothetical protein [Chitinophaga rhizophila]